MNEKQNQNQHDAYEHAFERVPDSKRKSLLSLIIVLAGYPIALSNFVIGGNVAIGLSFSEAMLALLAGNLVLICIVVATGIFAFRTGLSTAFLSRRAFGKSGSSIFSILLAISAVTWISLNGDIFARLIDTTFGWWFLSIPVTAVICILLWMQSAIRGFKGLHFISALGVPAALIMSAAGVIAVGIHTSGFEGITEYVPVEPITFTAGSAAVVGGWVFGAVITPDVCRFAKKESHVLIAGAIAFVIGCFGLQFAGALVAISTGYGDFTAAMAALGLSLIAFVAAIFCLWTTQDNNIYGASLALQNIIKETSFYGKITHKNIAVGISGLAALFAALGIYDHIIPIISNLSVLITPVPGLIIAEEAIVKSPNSEKVVNWFGIIAWLAGGITGFIALQANFFIPPVIGMGTSFVIYVVLGKLVCKNVSTDKSEVKA
ncbi:cytosine permease [Proteinivorax hydrogeniformans]|uniref:Cytosine permease n=1 Tax=Proteinivorax hydrogeniformans TaxID=1826727 RepID=A0AAU8HUF8_9FIRM